MQAACLPDRRATLVGLGTILLIRPARAEPEDMTRAIAAFTGGATPQPGRISLEIAPLVENGNSVSVAVSVTSPMTAADHVTEIALFNEKNPQPNVATFHLGPRAGKAWIATRIRLATTQHVTAVARLSDGSYWSDAREVIVTIAACTEE